jgi:hypothetical protein
MGSVHRKPSLICSSFLNQSVNLYSLGIVLSICANVNVDLVGIYSNFIFYFIIFSEGRGGGDCTTDHTPGSCRGGGPDSLGPRGAAPWGHPRQRPPGSQVPGCYLESEASQCSLSQTLRPANGMVTLSCWALC